MPLVRVPTAGSQIIASATVERRRTLTLAAGASLLVSDMQIQVNNLPNAFLYFYQPAGVNGLAFQPIFAVDNSTAGGVVIPRWLPLAPFQAVFVGVPAFFNFRVIATMLSVNVTYLGAAPISFDCITAASQ